MKMNLRRFVLTSAKIMTVTATANNNNNDDEENEQISEGIFK